MSNHLRGETSPYLRQHSENPVDWYPWCDEALAKARAEDKPILLSIGYSACHWCHVMAHESFENPEIARLMNEKFVNIKVDREERPDLDSVYMEAVQAITRQGGWPLTVFLTPDGKPFFGGTYFPPEDRPGMMGFSSVLKAVADAYHNRRGDIDESIDNLIANLKSNTTIAPSDSPMTADLASKAYSTLTVFFDGKNGGFAGPPKFPQTMALEFLLRYWRQSGDPDALQMVTLTLEKMAAGGIYDQIGGGFHRYATDSLWLVPHFEKMLYDNALLARLYVHAYQATGRTAFRRIAEETIDYVLADLTAPEGGFYSTRDADSEGIEGKYYVWQRNEIERALGTNLGNLPNSYYGATDTGNFEGSNILHLAGQLLEELPVETVKARRALLEMRRGRVTPGRDEKVNASWNGLMLATVAEAACVLNREDYLKAAVANGSFLLSAMTDGGYLKHTWKDGQARVEGFLDDYAQVVDGLINLHVASFSGEWLRRAISLTETMVDLFWDESAGTFYDSGRRNQELFVRSRNTYDNAVPSGLSAATMVLLKIARITGRKDFESAAVKSLRSMQESMEQYPLNFANWLCALDFHNSKPLEIALIGHRHDSETQALLRVVHHGWLPNKVVVATDPSDNAPITGLDILQGRTMTGSHPTAYVCERFACRAPVTDPEALKGLLNRS